MGWTEYKKNGREGGTRLVASRKKSEGRSLLSQFLFPPFLLSEEEEGEMALTQKKGGRERGKVPKLGVCPVPPPPLSLPFFGRRKVSHMH